MTPADLSPDSSDSASVASGRGVIPPPPPPHSTLPPVRKPSEAKPREASAGTPTASSNPPLPPTSAGLQNGNSVLSARTTSSVPPIAAGESAGAPDPIAANAAVSKSTASPTIPASGVGATTGVRWQGELEAIEDEVAAKEEKDPDVERRRSLGRWLASAPSWLISTVLHLLIFIILALITLPDAAGIGKIVFEMGTGDPEDSVEFTEFEIESVDSPLDQESNDLEVVEQIEVPTIVKTIEPMRIEMPDFMSGAAGETGEVTVPMFGGRTGAMKKVLMAAFGGTQETQDAVQLGLKWLQRNQRKDGAWSMSGPYRDGGYNENKCAATAMAILAFAGDGNTHLSGPYKDEVNRAIRVLVKMQDRRGLMAHQGAHHSRAYAQAQATIAICELYGMTGDSWLRQYAEASVDYAVKAQSPQGGWRYIPKQDADTSVTGWYVMALQSAKAAGIEFHLSALGNVHYFLDSVESEDGAAYAYQPLRPSSAAMRAEGLLCRQYLGWTREDDAMRRGVNALVQNENFDLNQRNVYYWYYATQVLHHFGDSPWRVWNDKMSVQLPNAQIKRGREAGSWAPQADEYGNMAGRLYTTCLSIYCLEVYYRHLPIYGLDEEEN